MKVSTTLCALILSVAMSAQALADGCCLGRLLNRGGCGCDRPTTCCDAPAHCGRGFHLHLGLHVALPRLRGNCCAPACDTGCDRGAVAAPGCGCDRVATPCCDTGCGGGLLSGFGGFNLGRRGCCQPANDCCDPCARVSIFDNFRGRLACRQPRCCEPAACEPRCRERRQICFSVPNFGLIDRLRSCGCGLGNNCGCDQGCDTGCDTGFGRVRCRPVRTRLTDCGCGCDPVSHEGHGGNGGNGGAEPEPGNGAQINRGTINNNGYIIRGAQFSK